MAELFSDEWMKRFMEEWNKEPELSDALAKINFNSVIAYGFDGEDKPRSGGDLGSGGFPIVLDGHGRHGAFSSGNRLRIHRARTGAQ